MADYLDREHRDLYCGAMRNAIVDEGVILSVTDDCKIHLFVDPEPITPENDSENLRDFMLATALSWLDQLEKIPFKNTSNDNEDQLSFTFHID